MIVNFSPDMKFRFSTTAGEAVLEPLRCGKSLCIGIEYDGTGEGKDTLEIKPLDFASANSAVRGVDGLYRWPLNGSDGNTYDAVMKLKGYPPQIIEVPALRARYFGEINGGVMTFGAKRELGRLTEGR